MHSFRIRLDPFEIDLPLCVTSGQVFRWQEVQPGHWFGVDGERWYVVELGEPEAVVWTNGSESDFRDLFGLEESMSDIHNVLVSRGPELKPILSELQGLRVMQPTSLHETLFCFMCTSNNHLKRITSMVRRLEGYGELMDTFRSYEIRRFPSIERIASIPEQELRHAGFGYRGRSIPTAAREICAKPSNWLTKLKDLPYEEAREELCTLHGIGPKLADCIALYGLYFKEATPFDTHLWQAYCRLYAPELRDQPLTTARYREAGKFMRDRFGEYAGIAHLYLYFENLKNWRKR